MKNKLKVILILLISLCILTSCKVNENPKEQNEFIIPKENIKFSHLTFGNVIQDGEQAVFLNFISDYKVTKIEYSGTFLDANKTIVHSFDSSLSFGTSSKSPSAVVMVESGIIKYIKTASVTKIIAYTDENINDIETFNVSFVTNGGSSVSTKQCYEIQTEPVTTRDGYLFDGWYRNSNFQTQVVFPFKLESDVVLYAKWIKLEEIMYCKDASIKFMDDDRNSSVVFMITPEGFDFSELASRGYKIRIDVEYDFYYKKDYDIPFDIGYMGSPKYEVSIFNSDKIGQFKSDLSTKSAIQTRTISYETAAANYENTIIYLQFSTDNIQNIIYFKNIVVSYKAYK